MSNYTDFLTHTSHGRVSPWHRQFQIPGAFLALSSLSPPWEQSSLIFLSCPLRRAQDCWKTTFPGDAQSHSRRIDRTDVFFLLSTWQCTLWTINQTSQSSLSQGTWDEPAAFQAGSSQDDLDESWMWAWSVINIQGKNNCNHVKYVVFFYLLLFKYVTICLRICLRHLNKNIEQGYILSLWN